MPPEFIKYNLTSKEYDIYSLGVIIIMIMVGPRVYSLIDDMKPAAFVELVRNCYFSIPVVHSNILKLELLYETFMF